MSTFLQPLNTSDLAAEFNANSTFVQVKSEIKQRIFSARQAHINSARLVSDSVQRIKEEAIENLPSPYAQEKFSLHVTHVTGYDQKNQVGYIYLTARSTDGGNGVMDLCEATIVFNLGSNKAEDSKLFMKSIIATQGEDDDYTELDCDVVDPQTVVAASMVCASFLKAAKAENQDSPLSRAIADLKMSMHTSKMDYETYESVLSTYEKNALEAFVSSYQPVTAADIANLWSAPEGTEFRFVRFHASFNCMYSDAPGVIIYPVPEVITVKGQGAEKILDYSRKSGVGGWISTLLPKITTELHQGTFDGRDDRLLFPSAVRVTPDVDLDRIRTERSHKILL